MEAPVRYETDLPLQPDWPAMVEIPEAAFTDLAGPYEFMVYATLIWMASKGETSPSSNRLADVTGMSKSKVIQVVNGLVSSGVIVKEKVSSQRNQFRVMQPTQPVHEVDKPVHEVVKPVHVVDKPVHEVVKPVHVVDNVIPMDPPPHTPPVTATATTAAAAPTTSKNTPSYSPPPKKVPTSPRMQRPTQEDVTEYMGQILMPKKEAAKYFDFYESCGWFVGKKPMRCWQAAARNWKRNYLDQGGQLLARPPKTPKQEQQLEQTQSWKPKLEAWIKKEFPNPEELMDPTAPQRFLQMSYHQLPDYVKEGADI